MLVIQSQSKHLDEPYQLSYENHETRHTTTQQTTCLVRFFIFKKVKKKAEAHNICMPENHFGNI